MTALLPILGILFILLLIAKWVKGRHYPQPRKVIKPAILTRIEQPRPTSAAIPELAQMARHLGQTYSEHDRAANRIVKNLTGKR
jgi:hypothetical protein